MKKYGVILADVPWAFRDRNTNGSRGACCKYSMMKLPEICGLGTSVLEMAADDCVLFLWVPAPLMLLGYGYCVMGAWGFTPKTLAFDWVKLDKRGKPALGMGHYTRQNTEQCWLGVRGKPKIASHAVRSAILAPRREHSRKPDEQYALIEQLCGDVPRVELFARQRWPGWDQAFSNEVDKFTPQVAAE